MTLFAVEAPAGLKRAKSKIWDQPPSPVVIKKSKKDTGDGEVSQRAAKKATKANKKKAQDLEAPSRSEIVNSFKEEYRAALDQLPECLRPISCKHGAHSYTRMVQGKARVEILLKNKSLKPKSKVDGTPIQSNCIRFTEWKQALSMCGVSVEDSSSESDGE